MEETAIIFALWDVTDEKILTYDDHKTLSLF